MSDQIDRAKKVRTIALVQRETYLVLAATMGSDAVLNNKVLAGNEILKYIRRVLIDRQGDSSTTFDRVMGKPIEQFDEPWRAWLNKLAGN